MLLSYVQQYVFPHYWIIDGSWHLLCAYFYPLWESTTFSLSAVSSTLHLFFAWENFNLEETKHNFWTTKDTIVLTAAMSCRDFRVMFPDSCMMKEMVDRRLSRSISILLVMVFPKQQAKCYYPVWSRPMVGWCFRFALVFGESMIFFMKSQVIVILRWCY